MTGPLIWGPHMVDYFACSYIAHLYRFNSGTHEEVDAFMCDWSGEINPPPYLIPRTIRNALYTAVCGTLLVPRWSSAHFWPMLFPLVGTVASFVTQVKVLTKAEV